jgi:hypothetical protein
MSDVKASHCNETTKTAETQWLGGVPDYSRTRTWFYKRKEQLTPRVGGSWQYRRRDGRLCCRLQVSPALHLFLLLFEKQELLRGDLEPVPGGQSSCRSFLTRVMVGSGGRWGRPLSLFCSTASPECLQIWRRTCGNSLGLNTGRGY